MADLDPLPADDFAQEDPRCLNCGELEEDCVCPDGFEPDDEDEDDDDDFDDEDDNYEDDDEEEDED